MSKDKLDYRFDNDGSSRCTRDVYKWKKKIQIEGNKGSDEKMTSKVKVLVIDRNEWVPNECMLKSFIMSVMVFSLC